MEWRFNVRGGVTTSVLQLVWQCDWAVLFVDVFFKKNFTPGVVHCFFYFCDPCQTEVNH